MSNSNKTVCIVGVFPPPVHGFALINEAMKKLILESEPSSVVYDLSSYALSRTPTVIFSRFVKFIVNYPKYLSSSIFNKYHTHYIGLSGGLGQFYDILFLLIARITQQRIFIHHHSFSYLNKKKIATYLTIWMAGRKATHIVLCNKMKNNLQEYRKILSYTVQSNSGFLIYKNATFQNNRQLKTIGFLGNISIKKGIKKFFKTLEKLNSRQIIGLIGGPFQDSISENYTRKELKNNSYITYLGPIYNEDKDNFFNNIDVLLMPSILEEAEPIVIHEAMSHGIPVIAFNKGCIAEIAEHDPGLIVDSNFSNNAAKLINEWIDNPKIFNQIRNNAYNRYQENINKANITLELLISHITNK